MRTIIDIALNDLRIIFSDRSIWINLVIIPLLIAYVVGFANGAGTADSGAPDAPKLIVDVINHDGDSNGSDIAQQFFANLRAANSSIVLCPLDNNATDVCQLNSAVLDETLAQQRIEDQTSLALIELPADFSMTINAGEDTSIVYRANEDASAPSYILQAVQAAVQKLGGALTAARVGTNAAADTLNFASDADRAAFAADVRQRANDLWAQDPVRIDYQIARQTESDQTTDSGAAGFSQSIPGIGTMYAMFIVLPAAAAIIQERKNWTLQRMAVLPISRTQILGGKLLARFVIGMLEYAIMFGFGALLGVRYGSDPVALVLIMVAFSLCVTALMLVLTTILKNVGQASGITLFLSLTLAPLGGAWWSLDIVPAWMRALGHISPVAWAMDGFHSLLFLGGSLSTVIVPILVLLGMTVVFFVYGVARFKFTD